MYNLGAFRHVDVGIDSTSARHRDRRERRAGRRSNRARKDSLADTLTDVRVDLREDFLRQYDQEEGWATLDCFRFSAQYTNKNFLERARRLELTARLSKIGYGDPLASPSTRNLCYRPRPRPGQHRELEAELLPGRVGAAADAVRHALGSRVHGVHRATRRVARLSRARLTSAATRRRRGHIGEGMPLRVGYTLEYGKTEAQPAVLCAVFCRCTTEEQEEFERNLRLAIVSVSLQRTRVDDRVEPTRGYVIARRAARRRTDHRIGSVAAVREGHDRDLGVQVDRRRHIVVAARDAAAA